MALLADTSRAGSRRTARDALPNGAALTRSDGMGATGAVQFTIPYRPFDPAPASAAAQAEFSVALSRGDPSPELPAVAAFLIDAVHGIVPLATIARMIGCYALASAAARGGITVEVASGRGDTAKVRVSGTSAGFEVEHTAFGAAHILHEDDVLGLYILEIAPDHTIPAHCHHVMREAEMILDNGLIQQGRPVRRGDAFDWPLGHVHAYHNPTRQPRRVLCIDSPRFDPADEVPLSAAPPLVPLAPVINYLV